MGVGWCDVGVRLWIGWGRGSVGCSVVWRGVVWGDRWQWRVDTLARLSLVKQDKMYVKHNIALRTAMQK